MAKAAQDTQLKAGFEEHLQQTEGHVERLEEISRSSARRRVARRARRSSDYRGRQVHHRGLQDACPRRGPHQLAQAVEHYEMAIRHLKAWATLLAGTTPPNCSTRRTKKSGNRQEALAARDAERNAKAAAKVSKTARRIHPRRFTRQIRRLSALQITPASRQCTSALPSDCLSQPAVVGKPRMCCSRARSNIRRLGQTAGRLASIEKSGARPLHHRSIVFHNNPISERFTAPACVAAAFSPTLTARPRCGGRYAAHPSTLAGWRMASGSPRPDPTCRRGFALTVAQARRPIPCRTRRDVRSLAMWWPCVLLIGVLDLSRRGILFHLEGRRADGSGARLPLAGRRETENRAVPFFVGSGLARVNVLGREASMKQNGSLAETNGQFRTFAAVFVEPYRSRKASQMSPHGDQPAQNVPPATSPKRLSHPARRSRAANPKR